MLRELLQGKLHHATVTDCRIDYPGSLTVDLDLIERSGLLVHQRIQLLNCHNGYRLETYLIAGERGKGQIIVNGAAARHAQRGDIVIIDSEAAEKRLVKRIVGLPGDTIYMRNNTLVINGQPADYEVVSSDIDSLIIREHLFDHSHEAMLSDTFTSRLSRSFGPETVPQDQFFVLGDNRDNSADSRIYSFIPRDQIIGRSSSVIFSLDSDRNYLPRADRFLAELQ